MAVQKLYPRATVKRIVKSHTHKVLTKNADILTTCYSYKSPHHLTPRGQTHTHCCRLMREASIQGRKRGDKGITARTVRRVTEGALRKFKG
ncbi:hypothetical protein HL42_4013 [Trichophyton rubrum]|nr:hypothetical protein HL42_4013 [Trichophyton rubrum]